MAEKKSAAESKPPCLEHGPLVGKAFPGRAAILVKLLDFDQPLLQAVYEKPGSMKIGHSIPDRASQFSPMDEFGKRQDKDVPSQSGLAHLG